MSQIRRQSIIASILVYIGFALGFLNTYLFTREGGLSQEKYGLIGIFMAIASLMYTVANMGMPAYIAKFYPFYRDNLKQKDNDMLTWSLLVGLVGFLLVGVGGVYFKNLIILKFGKNSPLLVQYYYWIFPFGFGLTIYSIVEAYSWQLNRAIITNYFREIQFRLFATVLLLLYTFSLLTNFDLFIKFFALTYGAIAIMLIMYLKAKKEIHFTFNLSRVTKKFYKKIFNLVSFTFGGTLLYGISLIFDSLVIASVLPKGLASVAVFSLGQYMASLIQAPQRGIIASAIGPLSSAWKRKDFKKIDQIYKQSSINQLIFATGIFSLIWLNFSDAIFTFHLQQNYLDARWVFFFVGLYRIVDLGTGVNAQIIGTSSLWRFEFYTGFVLLALTLPLTYFLTKSSLEILGPPIATLISFIVYNFIRCWFLWYKFKFQPFTIKTVFTLGLAMACYGICYLLFQQQQGIIWMTLRSILFILLFGFGTIQLKLSEDVIPVWLTLKKRMGFRQ